MLFVLAVALAFARDFTFVFFILALTCLCTVEPGEIDEGQDRDEEENRDDEEKRDEEENRDEEEKRDEEENQDEVGGEEQEEQEATKWVRSGRR
jgi:hypothetical protein